MAIRYVAVSLSENGSAKRMKVTEQLSLAGIKKKPEHGYKLASSKREVVEHNTRYLVLCQFPV